MVGPVGLLTISLCSYIAFGSSSSKYKGSMSVYRDYFERQTQNDPPRNTVYQTTSDSMELYSISSKKMVCVKEKSNSQSWNTDYELSVTAKRSGASDKRNKFVTETVIYGRLKIRSQDNNRYLCAKSNGDIVFKKNTVRKGRPKKRCLFFWEFTKQMHIQLYVVTSNKRRWYLAVQNDVVKLKKKLASTELEKSFIWLPTQTARSSQPYQTPGRDFGNCPARLQTCNKNYKECLKSPDYQLLDIKKLRIKNLKEKNRLLENELEHVKKELEELKNSKDLST